MALIWESQKSRSIHLALWYLSLKTAETHIYIYIYIKYNVNDIIISENHILSLIGLFFFLLSPHLRLIALAVLQIVQDSQSLIAVYDNLKK